MQFTIYAMNASLIHQPQLCFYVILGTDAVAAQNWYIVKRQPKIVHSNWLVRREQIENKSSKQFIKNQKEFPVKIWEGSESERELYTGICSLKSVSTSPLAFLVELWKRVRWKKVQKKTITKYM